MDFRSRARRNPHQVALLAAAACGAAGGLVAPDGSAVAGTLRLLPAGFVVGWYVVLLAGSVVGLVGMAWHGVLGLLIERAGLLMLSGLFLGYGALAWGVAGGRALLFSLFVGGFAAANLVRCVQIGRQLKELRAAAIYTDSMEHLR